MRSARSNQAFLLHRAAKRKMRVRRSDDEKSTGQMETQSGSQSACPLPLALIWTASKRCSLIQAVMRKCRHKAKKRGQRFSAAAQAAVFSDYDIIAIGTPTWWHTMAPAVRSFLAQHDFAGKTAVPFMTNGGWPGHVIRDMKALCCGAAFACEMEVRFDSAGGSRMESKQSGSLDRRGESAGGMTQVRAVPGSSFFDLNVS